MSTLEAQPLKALGEFNYLFLIEILVVGVLALFFLFYFNRLFATVVSYGIRAYTWHKYRAHIDITSLQISLLGGRIFFKSIQYHAHNITFFVYEGHVTWRYWLRLTQEADLFQEQKGKDSSETRASGTSSSAEDSPHESDEKGVPAESNTWDEEKAGTKPKKRLPCRISVKIAGVEAFIYNRSPLYDGIVEAAKRRANPGSTSRDDQDNKTESSRSDLGSEDHARDMAMGDTKAETEDTNSTHVSHTAHEELQIPEFLRIFPIMVECKRAAAAVGNENTTNVLVAKVMKAQGIINAAPAGPLDLYKLLFQFDIEDVNVTMKPNRDFKEYQLDAAQRILREQQQDTTEPTKPSEKVARKAKSWWQRLWPFFSGSATEAGSLKGMSTRSFVVPHGSVAPDPTPAQAPWHGLTRYLADNEDEEVDEWQNVEYAKAATLVECPKVSMCFYWDVPGPMREDMVDNGFRLNTAGVEDMNGALPPEYGMNLSIHGGFVLYGPWADRQRINLQQLFFPASYSDAVPSQPLKSGDLRVATIFRISVVVEEDVVLRIPSREPSKDYRWKGRAENSKPSAPSDFDAGQKHEKQSKSQRQPGRKGQKGATAIDTRPYGWLDITVKKDSVIRYTQDMYARSVGYRNNLDIDVKGIEMSSSVNHGLLWRSGAVTLEADLSYPLTWNSLRNWPFKIVCDDLELFILRDHMFLIIDLVNDWGSGSPPEFFTFVPFKYELDMTFRNFCMYLNVNDANIINDPADLERNDYLTIEGGLHALLGIPLEHYRPQRSQITFDVLAESLFMRLLSPSRSTFNAFLKEKRVVELPKLTLNGSYNSNGDARPGLTDVLRMNIASNGLSLQAYGFFVRQLVSIKENYFGDYLHFKTLDEFQSASEDLERANQLTASFPKPKSVNELDVILCIVIEDSTVMFPTNMYSADEFVRAEVPRADLDLRVTSYYLDMCLNLSPISILSGKVPLQDDDSTLEGASSTQLYISQVDLNGHRMFGLPPDEAAYVSEWDINVGKVLGELSDSFIRNLALAGRALAFTISDGDNALPLTTPSIMLDATFVQVRTDIIRLWMHVGKDALLLSAKPITVESNDWASEIFSQRVNILVPEITLACVDGSRAERHRFRRRRKEPVRTYAFLQTGVALDIVMRKRHFTKEMQKQQAHIQLSNQRTGRATFLRRSHIDAPIKAEDDIDFEPPAMCSPPLPPPLRRPGRAGSLYSIQSGSSILSGRKSSRKSSFVSLAASLRAVGRSFSTDQVDSTDREGQRTSGTSFDGPTENRPAGSHGRIGNLPQSNSTVDRERYSRGTQSATMAFSSPFLEPYFPLEAIEPDETNVPSYPACPTNISTALETSSTEEVIERPEDDTGAEHTTIFINLVPGIRAYIEPRVGITAATLFSGIAPVHPEQVLDAFQMDVMGTILSRQAEQHGHETVLEIHANLPCAHVRTAMLDDQELISDQVDLKIRALETLVRIRDRPSKSGGARNIALHNTLAEIELRLDQPQDIAVEGPAISLVINDVLLWLAIAEANSFHLSFRETSIAASGSHTQSLCKLVLRLLPIIKDLQDRFNEIQQTNLHRLQLLTFVLTGNCEPSGDAPFMTRMVSTLFAFPDHFRNQDSWKILMRFRYVLVNLSPENLNELKSRSKTPRPDCPHDAPNKTLESWTQWYNWDIPYVNQTLAFKKILNTTDEHSAEFEKAKPTVVTFRCAIFRITIQHHGDAAEILLEETSLGVENTPPITPEGLMLVEENTRTNTVVQMHMDKISFFLDWSLVEVAEGVLLMKDDLRELASTLESEDSRTASQALGDGLARHDFNLVLSTDTGKITLQTVNLRHVARSDGLKMSLIGTTRANEEFGQSVSAILTCDTAVTELRSNTQFIWKTLLTSPNLYIDHLHPAPGIEKAPTITVAVGYEDIQLVVLEQVPGILHVVDSIIVDEVAKVQHLISLVTSDTPNMLPDGSEIEKALAGSEQPSSLSPKLHLALLAGQVHVSISLLQELKYQLEGTAASVRVAPTLTQNGMFTVDFDVGRQNHAFVNTSRNENHTQGILQLPPINGNVTLELSDKSTSVSVATTIERIEVDAAAIQGVVGVVNRPEVQDIIDAIKTGIEDLQERVEDVIPSRERPKAEVEEQNMPLLLDVRFALLGVRVSASTRYRSGRSTSEVEFGIGPVHATASNRTSVTDLNPHFPEIRAKIQGIGARLFVKSQDGLHPCGHVMTGILLHFNSTIGEDGTIAREVKVRSDAVELHAYPETAALLVDVINHLHDKIKHLDVSKEIEYLRQLRDQRKHKVIRRLSIQNDPSNEEATFSPEDLLAIKTTIEFADIKACWLVDESFAANPGTRVEDLVLSISRVELSTRGGNEARLVIMDLQLQLAERDESDKQRSLNSALLPEIAFSVAVRSHGKSRSLAVKATGKPLDLRLESGFVLPLNTAQKSIEYAMKKVEEGTAAWENTPTMTGAPRPQMLDMKRLASLLVEADFAGAQVYMQGSGVQQDQPSPAGASSSKPSVQHGRYGQFAEEGTPIHTTLTSPGIAFKVEYNSQGQQPSVNAEIRIDASSNKLLPNVVPLVLEVSNGVKEVMQNHAQDTDLTQKKEVTDDTSTMQKFFEEDSLITANPSAIFGKTKVNIGVRVCRQEFGMTCQPIARVDAIASLDDLYFTMNTIDSDEYGHFFALSAVMTKLTAQVKHVYSNDPTFSYDMESIVLSAMNTKHLSGTAGVSAVLNFNPTRISINARQFQDLMLFREIWLPPEIRDAAAAAPQPKAPASTQPEEYLVQRYQTVAAAAAFPWNATISIAKLVVDLDLGQSIGKSSFTIENLWACQQKSSNWEQNLCIGLDKMSIDSTGRMSGFILLEKFGIRTSIKWPDNKTDTTNRKTPLIQASIGFRRLRAKAAYDYQPFAFGDIEGFDFLMYNVRDSTSSQDRLVAVLDFAKAYVFCTSTSPAQAVGLYQAFDRLIQDKQAAYAQSLKDVEKHLRRESIISPSRAELQVHKDLGKKKVEKKTYISLQTDVVVSLGALCFGVYPTTFFDSQMLKVEANTIQARFAVGLERGLITSVLSLTLGQLSVALSATRRVTIKPKASDVSVDDVISTALNAKGGIILRVPKVIASMQTWQIPDTNKVEYIFKSLLDGKIDVGWNLSRIDFIKGMWTAHSRALASRIGKSLPESAVKITASSAHKAGDPNADSLSSSSSSAATRGEKITAEIHLPQSRYEYTALEPPVIETPQLRDMGEATPPLEWIGLHRDRLPNVTHQIVIVSLLEVCKEVQDAYEKILGSS